MPVKNTKEIQISEPSSDWTTRCWSGLKELGSGLTNLLKLIFDFILKLIKSILYFSIWIVGAIAVFIFITALSIYLLSAGLGLKNNEGFQKYINIQIQKLTDQEAEVPLVETPEVMIGTE